MRELFYSKITQLVSANSVRKALCSRSLKKQNVSKMAQGRRPACCCLSEKCLLSGMKEAGSFESSWGEGSTVLAQDQISLLSARFWPRHFHYALPTKNVGVFP